MKKKRRSWGEKGRERRDVDFFTYGKEKEEEERGLSVMKLEILDFLLERFTDGFTGG
jgi:hypothetical protein